MEMTLPSSLSPLRADFVNRAAGSDRFPPLPTLGWMLISVIAGPGATAAAAAVAAAAAAATASAAAARVNLPDREHPTTVSAESDAFVFQPDAAAFQITAIKEGWQINMTELADILGVTRPTVYSWLKGKTSPDTKLQKHLQTLAAAAADWQEATAGSNWDFLLDYTGPRADEVTIREALGRPDVSTSEIRNMIHLRLKQYQEAYAQSREILGEPPALPKTAPHDSARRLNAMWAENAKKLHRFRNSSS